MIRVACWALAAAILLAACATTPEQEGPSEPAPPPPQGVLAAPGSAIWYWHCADESRLQTRYLPDTDALELHLLGRPQVLPRRQRVPAAAWGDSEVTFTITGAGAGVLRWQGEDLDCERVAADDPP